MTRAVMNRASALVIAFTLIASSCGGSDSSAEIATIQAGSDAAIAEMNERLATTEAAADEASDALANAKATIEEQAAAIEQLAGELEQANDDTQAQEAVVTRLTVQLDDARDDISSAEQRAIEAEAAAAELRARYDTELRADAQIAWDEELAEACAEAGDGSSSIRSYVDHNDELAIIGSETELVVLVTECAEPLRSRSEVEKLNARCERGSVDQVIKGPDELAGNCYIVFVIPWQWDSRTGLCNFLGGWDSSNEGTRRFNYDGDGLFRAPPSVCSDQLSDADQDDLLQVWVELTGSYRYDTAAGGTNEIPDFTILRAVLIAKA